MKRVGMLVAFALAMAGCGGDGNNPSVSQVTVTVRQGGGPVVSGIVQASTAAASAQDLGEILDAKQTDAAGQATFNVPASTSTGQLCLSSFISSGGLSSFRSDCSTLNALTPTVTLDHDASP